MNPPHSGSEPAERNPTPVVAIDVDGVLNPDHPPTARQLGYHPHHYDGPDPAGKPISGEVWLHSEHGTWLRELARRADLVWCTSWGTIAATWLAPRLGLPADLPVIDVGRGAGVRFGRQLKLAPLYRAVGGRPVAILDDEFGGRDPDEATERNVQGNPTLLVPVSGITGLQRHHVNLVHRWLDHLAADNPNDQTPGDKTGQLGERINEADGLGPTRPAAPDGGGTAPWPIRRPATPDDADGEPGDDGPALNVGDPALRKSRLLSRQCDTCIFRPGNLMHLAEGRLHNLVSQTRRDESFIVCHDTLPNGRFPDAKPAICRGFKDRYPTQALQVIERLFGFIEVDPPREPEGQSEGSPRCGENGLTG